MKSVIKTPISPSKREEKENDKIPDNYSQDSQEDDLDHFSETAALPLRMINDDLTSGGKDLNMLKPDHAPLANSLKLPEQEPLQFSEQ
jgi:hypothetical protein